MRDDREVLSPPSLQASGEQPAAPTGESSPSHFPGIGIQDMGKLIISKRADFALAILLLWISQALTFVVPLSYGFVLDSVISRNEEHTLNAIVTGLLFCTFLEIIFRFFYQEVAHYLRITSGYSLRSALINHCLELPLSYFSRTRAAELRARIEDLNRIHAFATDAYITLPVWLVFILSIIAVIALLSVKLAVVITVSIIAFGSASIFLRPIIRRRMKEERRGREDYDSVVSDILYGIKTIKSLHIEGTLADQYEKMLVLDTYSMVGVLQGHGAFQLITTARNRLTFIFILWCSASDILAGSLSVGEMVTTLLLVRQVNTLVERVAPFWFGYLDATGAVTRAREFSSTLTTPNDLNGKTKISGEVWLRDVWYWYEGAQNPAIHGADLHIHPASVVGLVGKSGSGKSTLAKLILGSVVPCRGQVLLGAGSGKSLHSDCSPKDIVYVGSDEYIFNLSIRRNISLRSPDTPLDDVVRVAKLVCIHDAIANLADCYETVLTGQNNILSNGQRQRITIARALLGNPKIVVLDEATSSLDQATEELVMANILNEYVGTTFIIAAHRASALMHAKCVFVVDGGRVVESGSPPELMSRDTSYKRLMGHQQDPSARPVHVQRGGAHD